MRVDFPLLSMLSVAFLLLFVFQGADIQLHSVEVGLSANSEGITVTIDPTWLVWADRLYPPSWLGEAFGNVAVVRNAYRDTPPGRWIARFELNHVIQYRALGWWNYLLGLVLPIDPQPSTVVWSDVSEPDRIEWLPPDWWHNVWHFAAIILK